MYTIHNMDEPWEGNDFKQLNIQSNIITVYANPYNWWIVISCYCIRETSIADPLNIG